VNVWMSNIDIYATTPVQYLNDYGPGPETGLQDAYEDPIERKKLEAKVIKKYRKRAFDGTPLIDPENRRNRNLNARRFERSNRYILSGRFLYGFLTLVYVVAVMIFYSVPYLFFGRGVELGSFYGALLAWNSFKPVLIYAVIFSITQQRLSMFITFIFGGFALFVIIGTFVLQIAVLHDIFVKCNGETNPTHPCNDPLYCCVYYSTSSYCSGKGPCFGINTTDLGIPYLEGTMDITKDDLKTNDNYNLMAFILAILFVLEIIFVRYFTNMLYTINSGFSFILDTTLEYEYEKRLPRDYEMPLYPEDENDPASSLYSATSTIDDDILPLPKYANLGSRNIYTTPSSSESDGGDEDDKTALSKLKKKYFNTKDNYCGKINTVFKWIKKKINGSYSFLKECIDIFLDSSVTCFNDIFVLRSEDPLSGNAHSRQHPPDRFPRDFTKPSNGEDDAYREASYYYQHTGKQTYRAPSGNKGNITYQENKRNKKKTNKYGSRLMNK
jgi:hypothetical protein